jgi:SHS2 domain-containing protein
LPLLFQAFSAGDVDSWSGLYYLLARLMERFEFIEHTADVGVRVWGVTLSELFRNAAYAMFSIMADLAAVRRASSEVVAVESQNSEELLVEWLRELLYLSSVRNYLFVGFDVVNMDETHLKAVCWGEPIDPVRHHLQTEVKTVTYHQLYIRQCAKGFEAQIIFDI